MVLTVFFDSSSPVSGVVYHQPVGSIVNAYLGPDNKEWMRTALVAACATEESDRSIAIHLERVTLAESITPDGPVRSGAFVDLHMLEWTNNEWRIRFSVKGEAIRKAGNEYGSVTGRPRRCGWFDVPLLQYTAMVNGFDSLIVTKLDVLACSRS